jgi:hypothetical protein
MLVCLKLTFSVGKHALGDRARKLDQGILITRFELPFNIWWYVIFLLEHGHNPARSWLASTATLTSAWVYVTTPKSAK